MNRARDLAQHTRAKSAVAQAGDDITDTFTFLQIQRSELFELQGFHSIFLASFLVNTRVGCSQFPPAHVQKKRPSAR
jgi:hypothetical protein